MDGKKIVIGITTRGRDADKFWFSLFHEIAHVVLGHVGKDGGISEEDERAANQWAEDALIMIFYDLKKMVIIREKAYCYLLANKE